MAGGEVGGLKKSLEKIQLCLRRTVFGDRKRVSNAGLLTVYKNFSPVFFRWENDICNHKRPRVIYCGGVEQIQGEEGKIKLASPWLTHENCGKIILPLRLPAGLRSAPLRSAMPIHAKRAMPSCAPRCYVYISLTRRLKAHHRRKPYDHYEAEARHERQGGD